MALLTSLTSFDNDHFRQVAERLYPQCEIHCLAAQGGCSLTFLVGADNTSEDVTPDRILQFRPKRFGLDIGITIVATQSYKCYAPLTKEVSLAPFAANAIQLHDVLGYEMEVISGVSYASVLPTHRLLTHSELGRQTRFVEEFADFVSLGWTATPKHSQCTGKVGSNINSKLSQLSKQLPTSFLCNSTERALNEVDLLQHLPIVLNHGDLIPSNIMIDSETGKINGLVDWAEAEYLPFGICLYGLEYLLGFTSGRERRDSLVEPIRPFHYYNCADDLRRLFWQRLKTNISALETDEQLMKAVVLAKTIGTLLWYGFAWDDGAIDRVVDMGHDAQELVYLEAFLCNNGLDEAACS